MDLGGLDLVEPGISTGLCSKFATLARENRKENYKDRRSDTPLLLLDGIEMFVIHTKLVTVTV